MADVLVLKDVKKEDVPNELKVETYFDFKKYPSIHEPLFTGEGVNSIMAVISGIGKYAKKWIADNIEAKKASAKQVKKEDLKGAQTIGEFEIWVEDGALFCPANVIGITKAGEKPYRLFVGKGTSMFGCSIFLNEGDIYIGESNTIEQSVGIKGPTIIGNKNEIRVGAYFRGNVIISNGAVLRGELKNVAMLDKANFPHPSYLGDSLCGYMTHFGNQATAANLGILQGIVESKDRKNIALNIGGKSYDVGTPKVGIIMGDWAQVGCNSVADPATFLAPYTIVYALTAIRKGFYGPNMILKNKPIEKGVIEISNLKR